MVIPSDCIDFGNWIKDIGLSVAVTPQTFLSIVHETYYQYAGSVKSISPISQPSPIKLDDDTLVLTSDVIKEYKNIVDD